MENIKYGDNSYSDMSIPSTLQRMRADCPREDVKLRWQLMHKNYLRCIFPVEERNVTVYELPGRPGRPGILVPLEEHIENLRHQNIFPVMRHNLTNYLYVPDVYRKLWRSMVQFIVYIHSKGLCTLGFSMDEIAMVDGELKFYKIDFKKSIERELRINDLRSIKDIIKQIMAPSLHDLRPEERVLPYMEHFYGILETGECDGMILSDHVAILSFEEILNFVVESHEKSKMFSRDDYLLIMNKVKDRHRSLEDIAAQDYHVWGGHVRRHIINAAEEQRPVFRNKNIFRCARNAAAHLVFGQYGIVNNNMCIGIAIMACFGGVIAKAQEAMDTTCIAEAKAIRKEYVKKTYLSLLNYTSEDEKCVVARNQNTPEVEGSDTTDNV